VKTPTHADETNISLATSQLWQAKFGQTNRRLYWIEQVSGWDVAGALRYTATAATLPQWQLHV
jgi:hypothetical protein